MLKNLLKAISFGFAMMMATVIALPETHAADFTTHQLQLTKKGSMWVSPMVLEKQAFNSAGIKVEGHAEELMVNFGKGWEEVILHDDYALGNESLMFTSPTKQIQFKAAQVSEDFKLNTTVFYHFEDGVGGPSINTAAINSEGLQIISRTQWGADEKIRVGSPTEIAKTSDDGNENTCPNTERYAHEYEIVSTENNNALGQPLIWPIQKTSTIEKFAVHHTDSQIKDVTGDGQIDASDYKAIVRAIYSYHTKTRGWGDIGYNYLIDPLGNIYEGRYGGDTAIGAHSLCFNPETLGIALIGNYDNQPITKPAFEALTKLIAQKSKQYTIDPLASSEYRGKFVDNVFGHKDVRSTACPGLMLYNQLPQVRSVAASQQLGSLFNSAPSASPLASLDINAELVSILNPIQLQTGERQTILLNFKNTGNQPWDNATWLHASGNDRAENGRVIPLVEDKIFVAAHLEEAIVNPGETGTFEVTVEAGPKGGNVVFQLTPVVNGQYKLSKAQVTLAINSNHPALSAQTSLKSPKVMKPGEKKFIEVEMKNMGDVTWTPETVTTAVVGQGLEVSKRFIDSVTVLPGEKTKLGFYVEAPNEEGYFSVYLRSRYKLGDEWVEIQGAVANLIIQVTHDPKTQEVQVVTQAPQQQLIQPTRPYLPEKPFETPKIQPNPNKPKLPNLSEPANQEKDLEPSFRVKLSHEANSAILTANTAFSLMNESHEALFDLPSGSQVEVKKLNGGFEVKSGTIVKKATVVRLVPKEFSGVTEIVSMKRSPAWNPNLNDNQFRGIIEMRLIDGEVTYINELPLEDYLRGLAEETNTAPLEKQKVIAVLARTYAQFYMDEAHRKFPGMPYDGSDDPNEFQRYLGYGVEVRSPNFVKAVEATEDVVVTYNGELVKTPYFSSSDGQTRSAEEIWGWTNTPYLKSVADPWSKGQNLQGHGVGLSGSGATKQAELGKTFEEIIKYYYTGVEVEKMVQ